jgi:D-sedoheptulose 7-phosphate isomerase
LSNIKDIVIDSIKESIATKKIILDNMIDEIVDISSKVIECYKNGNKVLIAGNGGSASDAQHISAELVSRFYFDREALSAIALTTDTSIMTAIGNDYSFDNIFSRQIEAIGNSGDIFWAISTSGNSKNIIKAIDVAKRKGLFVFGLSGGSGGAMRELCDKTIIVPSNITPRIQESHIMIAHIICEIVEKEMFQNR